MLNNRGAYNFIYNDGFMKVNIESLNKSEPRPPVYFEYALKAEDVPQTTLEALSIEKIKEMRIHGRAEKDEKTVIPALYFDIDVSFEAICARCGRTVDESVNSENKIYISFNDPEGLADGAETGFYDEMNFYFAKDGRIDLIELAMEFFEFSLPYRFLCTEECKGICQDCGRDLNEGECGCKKSKGNPAFRVLDGMFDE